MSSSAATTAVWQVWIDTGGTFTDGMALAPDGEIHRVKVLSSSALRGRFEAAAGSGSLRYSAAWNLPDRFATGARLRWLERPDPALRITESWGGERRLEVTAPSPAYPLPADPLPADLRPGEPFEILFDDEAPVLAARLLTSTPPGDDLPPMAMRLATTHGTNALLERRGARCVLCVTRGFADLLLIGNQQRHDLFALDVRRSAPLYEHVIEVAERLDADGEVVEKLDLATVRRPLAELAQAGIESAAVALLHSYRNPDHEIELRTELERAGFRFVALSSELAPVIKILPRAETAVVDAYLAPIIDSYLRRVESVLAGGRLHVMTSAGGLVRSSGYRAKDSLLSGPAGGVVGAARSGRECGFERLIAFDMGGTSTDVSRFDGDYEYAFEHRVGDASVAAPALAIETVAAGGGSICHREGEQLKVGPASAGAHPGPACYGAGGPLTLTDVNLLLGRLDGRRFGVPIEPAAAAAAAIELLGELAGVGDGAPAREALLAGFLEIADERMADAIRRISIRRGYDPQGYALVAFGGAGGQHACAVARLLGMETVVAPRDAGLLSALGIGSAVVERFEERQVLCLLDEAEPRLESALSALAERAVERVASEGVGRGEIVVRRRLAYLRFLGQETTLEIELDPRGAAAGVPLRQAFLTHYEALYGYRPPERPIEIDSLRVVASSLPVELATEARPAPARVASATDRRRAFLGGSWRQVPIFLGDRLEPGDGFAGPALVLDDHATLVVESGWRGRMAGSGALILERSQAARG